MSVLTAELESNAIRIPVGGGKWLDADITTPADARGIVLFAHGSGSSRSAAALDAAAARPNAVRAVVSRGGRPDLATHLEDVLAPTLLLVGGHDLTVIRMNRDAFGLLNCRKELEIIPGATHLFEEPGKLEAVAAAAGVWFRQYLKAGGGESEMTVIKTEQWKTFTQCFTREHDGWSASLQVRRSDHGEEIALDDRPFRGVSFEDGEGRDVLILKFGGDADEHLMHVVEQPREMAVLDTEAEAGACSFAPSVD